MLHETGADTYEAWLSGPENFRKILYPDYKAHREHVRKPEWLQQIREFLVTEWKAKITDGYEADDAIGIVHRDDDVIASVDKDLLQIAGRHYNFVKGELVDVDYMEALRAFWKSMLVGDRADNVPGIPGIGDVRGTRILSNIAPENYKEIVFNLYEGYPELDFDINYKLLRVLRSEEEYMEINENIKRQGERQRLAKARSKQDTGDISGANQG